MLFIYLYRGDLYSDLWKSDLYFRPAGKVLLSSFHLNGHTLGFHPQTQKLEPPCTAL